MALLATVLIPLAALSAYRAGILGLVPTGRHGQLGTSSKYRSIDGISVGSVVSANEAWVVQSHTSVYETQPGFYSVQPGTTPFSIAYRTTDGGRTWARKLRLDVTYDSMRFSADGRRGVIWVATGLIYRTVDGGDHWSVARTPAGLSVYALTFLDPDHGWAVLFPAEHAPLTVYVTSDGGQTWQARGSLDLTPLGMDYRLQFSDTSHGLFLPTELGTGWPVLLVTDDGGQSWRRVGPAIAPDADTSLGMSTSAPTVFPDGTGMLIVIDSKNHLYAYSTTDHGMTWNGPRRVALPAIQANGQVVQRVWIADARHWWVRTSVATNGRIASSRLITTADAGQHWTSPPSSPYVVDVVFASPTTGWAMYLESGSSSERLARTTDGGKHWTTIALPPAAGSR